MRYLFSFRKDVFVLLLLCAIGISSCTNEDEVLVPSKVEPGIYTIEMTIDTQNAITRGVNNGDFDMNYDEDSIYLHCGEDSLVIPVYSYCDECEKGIRYRIEVQDDGRAILTPIDENGELMGDSLVIPADSSCYFSSWYSCNWEIPEAQITMMTADDDFYFFHRKNDLHKEIYRSKDNYTINDLATSGDLTIVRACAGFDLVAIFYDSDNVNSYTSELTADKFKEIMGDDYTNWYVKIYIGGVGFTENYDLKSNTSAGKLERGGYYVSGDSVAFKNGDFDSHKYLPFSSRGYGSNALYYIGLGYYTASGSHLFSPVTGEEINVYVLIKHWTGSGDPDDRWLLDDSDAVYTKVDLSGTSNPVNNSFYTFGLLMDLEDFKEAWDEMGGDNYTSTSNVVTRGLGLKASREFFLKDAKVICESY